MLENYGFSLLEIIRKNPKEITINFRSENGRKIREKYMSLRHKVKHGDSEVVVQLFHDIRDTTDKFAFTHPQGLLFQTQFQQPALTLVEKASFEGIRDSPISLTYRSQVTWSCPRRCDVCWSLTG